MLNNFKRKATEQLKNKEKNKKPEYQIQTRSSAGREDNTSSSSSLSTISEESFEMAQPQDIFNNLRIPDVIKDLQTFDGNPKSLPDFVKSVEEILLFIRNTDNTPYGQVLLRAIRNKIIGQANEALNNHLTPLNWDEIKKVITDLYTDKRNESTLIRELHSLKQYNKTTTEFYSSIIEIQSLLLTNIRMKETNQTVMSSKKLLYEEICLDVFLSGLKEPLGAIIRAMRPTNISAALSFCQKEEAITGMNPPNYKKQSFYPKANHYYGPKHSNEVVPYNKRPYQNPQLHQQPKRFMNNQWNSNSNQQQQNYGNNNNYPQIKSSPSSMAKQNTNMSRNNFSQQSRWNRQNAPKIGELNNICNQEPYPNEAEQESNIDDTQNFQNFASNHRADT